MKTIKDLCLLLGLWLMGRADRKLMASQMEIIGHNILEYEKLKI